jgi:hypothetical protein
MPYIYMYGLNSLSCPRALGLKLAKSISSKPDIISNLGMLGMNVSPTNLSMSYHLTFGYSKQELRLKIYFS